MPITNGRYGALPGLSRRQRMTLRGRWLRHWVSLQLARPSRLPPEDTRVGHVLYREFGCWTVRPVAGWRARRWITPPTHATRAIAGDEGDAACDWAGEVLGIWS